MLALWVEKRNCRRCFSSRMRGTTPSVMKRLSRSSLIDDERRFGLEQQQEQDRGGLLAGGEDLECLPLRGLPGGSRIESDRDRRGGTTISQPTWPGVLDRLHPAHGAGAGPATFRDPRGPRGLPIRKVLVLTLVGGVSPPVPVFSLLFSASYPQACRSYYLFFNYLFFTTCMSIGLCGDSSLESIGLCGASSLDVYRFMRGKLDWITGICG